jgi:hypothetical protein
VAEGSHKRSTSPSADEPAQHEAPPPPLAARTRASSSRPGPEDVGISRTKPGTLVPRLRNTLAFGRGPPGRGGVGT